MAVPGSLKGDMRVTFVEPEMVFVVRVDVTLEELDEPGGEEE